MQSNMKLLYKLLLTCQSYHKPIFFCQHQNNFSWWNLSNGIWWHESSIFLSMNTFISLLASNFSIWCKCSKYNAPGGMLGLANVGFFSVPFVKIAKHGISWTFLFTPTTEKNSCSKINWLVDNFWHITLTFWNYWNRQIWFFEITYVNIFSFDVIWKFYHMT